MLRCDHHRNEPNDEMHVCRLTCRVDESRATLPPHPRYEDVIMLQIVQGMYFRPVPLTDTLHRGIFYTNLRFFGDQAPELVFGRLLPSTTHHGVRAVTVEAREQLETRTPSGQREALAATTGDQLLDEIADVIAFCLNAVCVRDHDMARRLIASDASDVTYRRGPSSILRQTFDAMVKLTEEGLADLDAFLRALIALQRKSYETALRAIRQIVAAMLIVDEDATLAYTLMVAALESLGQATEPHSASWEEYDSVKRQRIEAATKGLSAGRRERIEAAVLANEHIGLQRRFIAFVLGHVEPSFYRHEAIGAVFPIAAADLPRALRQAYAIRSRNVHALSRLAPEVWKSYSRTDTAWVDSDTLLSVEGLARLSRHVVRRFVERAPRGVDAGFDYRSALPDIIRARWAPQYWIHQAGGFDQKSAPAYLNGMISFLIEGLSKRNETGLTDMKAVLDIIEATALGLSKPSDRLPMAGIMALWNAFARPADRRKLKPKLQKRFAADLAEPSVVGFAVATITGKPPVWELDAFSALTRQRRTERMGNAPQPMPARIDAALHIVVADKLLARGDRADGLTELGHAVETVPGLADLVRFEDAITRGENPVLHLNKFVLGEQEFVDWDKTNDNASAATEPEPSASPPP